MKNYEYVVVKEVVHERADFEKVQSLATFKRSMIIKYGADTKVLKRIKR